MGDTSRLRTGLAMLWLPLLVSTGLVRLLPCGGRVPAFFPFPWPELEPASAAACLCLLPFLRGRTMCVSIQERSLDPNIVLSGSLRRIGRILVAGVTEKKQGGG